MINNIPLFKTFINIKTGIENFEIQNNYCKNSYLLSFKNFNAFKFPESISRINNNF
jgi:hypothetical protein